MKTFRRFVCLTLCFMLILNTTTVFATDFVEIDDAPIKTMEQQKIDEIFAN